MASAVPKLVKLVKPQSLSRYGNFERQLMENFCRNHNLLAMPSEESVNVGNIGGERSYAIFGSLAVLEKALLRFTMNELMTKHNFTPVVVPNILYDHIIQRCGFPTQSTRSQVYKISGTNKESIIDSNAITRNTKDVTHNCIAGTSEFALAAIHIGDNLNIKDLPKKYCAQSRCYRAETSSTSAEYGLFRVHYFNKIEMFAFTEKEKSHEMLEEFINIQQSLFDQLELHYKILDMPKEDLGLPANRKYDIEAYMEGRKKYGEISSASNCKDYQSSRLNIKYTKLVADPETDQLSTKSDFVHTVNGTACATTRMLISIIEQHQTSDGRVAIPKVLVPYINGVNELPLESDENLLKDIRFRSKKEEQDTVVVEH